MYNALGGSLDAVKTLVEEGADINQTDRGITALVGALAVGRLDVIEFLVTQGADINYISPTGDTALFAAAEAGKLAAIEFLLER